MRTGAGVPTLARGLVQADRSVALVGSHADRSLQRAALRGGRQTELLSQHRATRVRFPVPCRRSGCGRHRHDRPVPLQPVWHRHAERPLFQRLGQGTGRPAGPHVGRDQSGAVRLQRDHRVGSVELSDVAFHLLQRQRLHQRRRRYRRSRRAATSGSARAQPTGISRDRFGSDAVQRQAERKSARAPTSVVLGDNEPRGRQRHPVSTRPDRAQSVRVQQDHRRRGRSDRRKSSTVEILGSVLVFEDHRRGTRVHCMRSGATRGTDFRQVCSRAVQSGRIFI